MLVSSTEKVTLKPSNRVADRVGARLSGVEEVLERGANCASKDPKEWHDPLHPFLRLQCFNSDDSHEDGIRRLQNRPQLQESAGSNGSSE